MNIVKNRILARILVFVMLFTSLFAFGEFTDPEKASADGEPTLTVLVKDSVTGEPLTGYTAVLQHEEESGWDYVWVDFETQANSSADGIVKFTKELIQDWGPYRLVISKDGYSTYEAGGDDQWYATEWPTGTQEISLTPAGVTTKKVTVKAVDSETGDEIEGAEIKLYNEAYDPRVEVERNDDGAWYLELNRDHFFYAYATAEGYSEGQSSGIFAMNTTPEEVTIELEKEQIVDPLEEAKETAKTELENYRKDDDFEDKDAVQAIRDSYSQQIEAAESVDAVEAVLAEAKGKIDEQPLNPPTAYHTLTVKDQDTDEEIGTFTAEVVVVRKLDSGTLGDVFETSEDGKFYNQDFDTNKYYKLRVNSRGYEEYVSTEAYEGYGLKNGSVTLPNEVKLRKAQPAFEIQVKDQDTGSAVSGFTATVEEKKYPNDYAEFETNADGVFYKAWDKWNDYRLIVTAKGYKEKVINFDYTGQDHVYPTEVELEPIEATTATISVRFNGVQGEPARMYKNLTVRSDEAFRAGITTYDDPETISMLDAVVAANKAEFGSAFKASEDLTVLDAQVIVTSSQWGPDPRKMFNVATSNWNQRINNSTEGIMGITTEVADGDLVSIGILNDPYWGDMYIWTDEDEYSSDSSGNVEVAFTAQAWGAEEPVSGATAVLKDKDGNVVATAVTDENGVAAFKPEQAGDLTCEITVSPYEYSLLPPAVDVKVDENVVTKTAEAENSVTEANEANEKADSAKRAADDARTAADASKKAADDAAKTPGQAAVDAAKKAEQDAKKAADEAGKAKDAADAAKAKADDAVNKAQEAFESAQALTPPDDDAVAKAQTVLDAAKEAQSDAKNAQDAANKAKDAADKALADANDAVKAAEKAKEEAEGSDPDAITPSDKNLEKAKTDKGLAIDVNKVTTAAKSKKKQMIVTWKKSKGATNYKFAYKEAKAMKWTETWTKGKTKFVMKKMKKNGLYEFKIMAVKKDGSEWLKSGWSEVNYRFYASTKQKATAKKKSVLVKVKKVKKASGYEVLYGKNKAVSKMKVKAFKGAKKTKLKVKGLKSKQKVLVRSRPYKMYKGKKYVGILNKARKVKVK